MVRFAVSWSIAVQEECIYLWLEKWFCSCLPPDLKFLQSTLSCFLYP